MPRAEAPAEEKFLPPCSSVLHFHLSPVQGVERVTVAALVTSSESLVVKCLSGKPSETFGISSQNLCRLFQSLAVAGDGPLHVNSNLG